MRRTYVDGRSALTAECRLYLGLVRGGSIQQHAAVQRIAAGMTRRGSSAAAGHDHRCLLIDPPNNFTIGGSSYIVPVCVTNWVVVASCDGAPLAAIERC